MCAKHLIKKSIILGTIFLITLGFIFPVTILSAEPLNPDPDDGVWMDSFKNENNVDPTN